MTRAQWYPAQWWPALRPAANANDSGKPAAFWCTPFPQSRVGRRVAVMNYTYRVESNVTADEKVYTSAGREPASDEPFPGGTDRHHGLGPS